jgi:hypothetical protein
MKEAKAERTKERMKEEAEDGKMWMEEEYKGNRKH